MDSIVQHHAPLDERLEAELEALESQMPALQARAGDLFALASAWAERHDAIIAATPAPVRAPVEARLRRIGIRWGMMHGARVTQPFPALPAEPPARTRG
jgi:hypothetical protein